MNSNKIEIAPSILSADFAKLGEQVLEAERAGADRVHIDVMDGHFVPNITIGPLVMQSLKPITHLPMDVHLMIEKPERYISAFCEAGAQTLMVQVETCPHLHRTIQQIREFGVRPGVVLNPATPLCTLEEILPDVDQVLIMTVNPGFGGQKLIPAALDKVRRLRAMLDERGLVCDIEVDGGINASTLADAVGAGANVLVMGSAVFGAPEGIAAAMAGFREMIAAAL